MRNPLLCVCTTVLGLLAAPTSADDPASPLSVRFGIEVRAALTKAGCNQGLCHGNLTGKGAASEMAMLRARARCLTVS